jgi:hypothetical protein
MGGIGAFGTRRWRDHDIVGFDRKFAVCASGRRLRSCRYRRRRRRRLRSVLGRSRRRGHCVRPGHGTGEAGNHLPVVRSEGRPGSSIQVSSCRAWPHIPATELPSLAGSAQGDRVRAGQLLGFISPNVDRPNVDRPHLHFEMRVQVDPGAPLTGGGSVAVPGSTMAVDPTAALYRFDAERWPRARDAPIEEWSMTGYLPITRLRIMPWVVTGSDDTVRWHTQTLLQVMFEQDPEGVLPGRPDFYLPVDVALPRERLMIETLRSAFDRRQKVRAERASLVLLRRSADDRGSDPAACLTPRATPGCNSAPPARNSPEQRGRRPCSTR